MAGGNCAWSRRVAARMRTLRGLVKDTHRALNDVSDILHIDPEVLTTVQSISKVSTYTTALVVLGSSPAAKARLLHSLIGRRLLPEPMQPCNTTLLVQSGSATQVRLTVGNSEFEIVEELECNKKPWDTLPLDDLIAKDQEDFSTVLEVDLNCPFLKDGLKIIVPPDIPNEDQKLDLYSLKKKYSELYSKRESTLKNYNPVFLYALDRYGKNIFFESIGKVEPSRTDDIWKAFNLYNTSGVNIESEKRGEERLKKVTENKRWRSREPFVFTSKNCLDLHQVKQLNRHSQLFFILLSDSKDITEGYRRTSEDSIAVYTESTESTEHSVYEDLPESDQELVKGGLRRKQEIPTETKPARESKRLNEEQIAFMNELLDQWELMTNPTPKHYVKSQYTILNDTDVLTIDRHLPSHDGKSRSEKERDGDKVVKSRTVLLNMVVKFATDCLQSYLLDYCSRLSEVHVKLLQQFILASFDLARELQVVPKKIQFVARQEQYLYETIYAKFSGGEKKQELLEIIQDVLNEMKTEIVNMDWSVDDLPCHQDHNFTTSTSFWTSQYDSVRTSDSNRTKEQCEHNIEQTSETVHFENLDLSDGEEAESYDSYNFDDYEIIESNDESLSVSYFCKGQQQENLLSTDLTSRIDQIRVENESELSSLSHAIRSDVRRSGDSGATCTNRSNISLKQATLDVQQTVLSKLSRKISLRLVKFVDCLRDSYFGTLQRLVIDKKCVCVSALSHDGRFLLKINSKVTDE